MELTQLKFVVDTSDLKNAATEIERLGVAVNKLNKPMQEATKASSNLNKEQSKSAEVSKQVETSTRKNISVLERQQMILEFMTQGLSKGQASIVSYAKANGAAADTIEKLIEVVKTQKALTGGDPFDKSAGAIQTWTNKLTAATEAQNLYNQGVRLNYSQLEELGREKLRINEQFKLEGKTVADADGEYKKLVGTAVQLENTRQGIVDSIKASEKATMDAAKASAYLAKEDDRVNRLVESKGQITSATNNKLIAYEQNLRKAGITGKEAAEKLDVYKKGLESIQKASGQRQVDYLSRALGPQITDVFVGLATGQSPLMVLLQQGGQLRDQFALAGVAGADMGKMLVEASKAMITSVKDVAVAVGGLLFNAITSTGSAIVSGFLAPIRLGAAYLYDMATGATTTEKAIESLKVAFLALGRAGILIFITAAVTAVVALKDLIKEQQEVSKAANLFGGSLGLTTDAIYSQAQAFAGSEGSVTKYIGAINAAAKAGVTSSSDLKLVSDAVVALQKVGVDADETAKRFANLGKEPTKELRAFAKESGLIKPVILEQVRILEEQGKKSEAVALATKSMSDAMVDASKKIQGEQGYILRAFNFITQGAKDMWDAILNIGRPTSIADQLLDAESELENRMVSQAKTAKGPFNRQLVDADTEKLKKRISTLREQLVQEQQISKAKTESSIAGAAGEEADKARKKAQDELNKALEYTNGLLSKSDGFTADYTEKVKMLNEAFKTGKFSLAEQNEAWAELLKQQPIVKESIKQVKDAEEERKKTLEAINNIEAKADLMGKEYYSNLMAINKALELNIINQEQANDLRKKAYEATPGMRAFFAAQTSSTKTVTDMQAQMAKIQGQYGIDLQPARVKQSLEAELKLRQSYAEADALLIKQTEDAKRNIAEEKRDEAIDGYKRENEVRKQLATTIHNYEKYLLSDSYQRQKAYADAFENLFSGMADAIVEFAKTGKLSFSDLVDNMIADLIRFEIQMQTKQMYGAIRPGIANMLSNIFGGQSINPNSGEYMGSLEFAKGGAFTNKIVDSPTMFKFAKGTGLMGEAGPEAIMPLTRDSSGKLGVQASGSGSNVSVQVINNTNAMATTNETVDSKGNRKVEVVIGEMTAGEISRSGSASQKSIRSTFGIAPQLIRR